MNLNLSIKTGESYKDYKIRLSKNKDLYGISWKDIAELLNNVSGNNYNESTYRKWWKAYSEGMNDYSNTQEDNSEIDIKKVELEKEKIKFYDQRRAYNKIVRESARTENLFKIVSDSLKNVKEISYRPNIDSINCSSNNDLFVGLNDIHYGANIDNYWNKYNPTIVLERLNKYLLEILKIKKVHNSENCYVCSNGDLISGKIHTTLEISNCENVVGQIKGVSEALSWFLKSLCENFKNVYFCVVSGNHSRIGKKDEAPKGERLDDLIPWYIDCRLNSIPNFHIINNNIDSTLNLVNIRGLNYLNVHGDYDGFSTIQKLISMVEDDVYCIHFGHKHHNAMDYNQKYKIIMSGSLMGVDDYCIEKRIYGKAQQLVGVCTENGMVCTYDINLQ